MSRLADMTIRRKPIVHETPWLEYWATHAPDAQDLAEALGISARRVRELWQEGWITKGGSLTRAINEWAMYRRMVRKEGRGGQKPGGGHRA